MLDNRNIIDLSPNIGPGPGAVIGICARACSFFTRGEAYFYTYVGIDVRDVLSLKLLES